MSKFYVSSGTLRMIVSRKDALEASITALSNCNKFDYIDEYFYVDERGYKDYVSADPTTNVIPTNTVMKASSWMDLAGEEDLP